MIFGTLAREFYLHNINLDLSIEAQVKSTEISVSDLRAALDSIKIDSLLFTESCCSHPVRMAFGPKCGSCSEGFRLGPEPQKHGPTCDPIPSFGVSIGSIYNGIPGLSYRAVVGNGKEVGKGTKVAAAGKDISWDALKKQVAGK